MFDFYVALANGQQSSFKQFLQQPSLMGKFKKMFTYGTESAGISQQLLKNKTKCLRTYRCFHEAGDMELCKSIEDAITPDKQRHKISFRDTRLSASDLECLAIFLACSSNNE